MGGINSGIKKIMTDAKKHTEPHRKLLTKLVNQGLSQRSICDALNKKGIKSNGGNDWYVSSLATALKRLNLETRQTKLRRSRKKK